MKDVKIYTVLIAPLDWGLGHATRCIPIIRLLYARGFQVIIATDGSQKHLLQQEFPTATFVSLPGYNINYGKSKQATRWKLFAQIPTIFKAINAEHKWLTEFVKQNKVDLIISDNRYGFYQKHINSVLITHQLNIITNNTFTESIVRRLHYRLIKPFNQCWIPDNPYPDNLAGRLSNPVKFPTTAYRYIGWLFRFDISKSASTEVAFDACIILSGPEPQRTILEEKILKQSKDSPYKIALVRGLPNAMFTRVETDNLLYLSHLPGNELNDLVLKSKYVICRGGYTSLMEMIGLQKKLILVPTPAQTEQEYLAALLHSRKWALHIDQEVFNLTHAIKEAESFPYDLPVNNALENNQLLEQALNAVVLKANL